MMLLEMASGAMGDRVAVGSRDDGLTYEQLFARAGAAAAVIRGEGVANVGMVDISSSCLPITLFASAWAGTPFVPMNYRLTEDELRYLAGEIRPALAVCGGDYIGSIDSLDELTAIERSEFISRLEQSDQAESDWSMDPDDIAVLLFTSGTTGAPKAAVLRHKHLVSYIITSVEFMGAGEDEATLVSVPPYHVAGMAAILSSVYAGRRIVQLPNFEADAWIDLAREQGVTHAMVVPTMLARIVDRIEERGLDGIPTLRALSYGGGKMPASVIARALDALPNTNFVNAYGLTETSSTIAILGPDDHREAHASDEDNVRRRLGSVGQPLPTIEVEIRDADEKPVPVGERGEIWVRGEQVSGEYLGRGSSVNAEGWFPTRDGGSLDDDGFLYIEGRVDDIIVRGGENISPGEIEDTLTNHPSVEIAAAIGVPSTQWGEAVVCIVVPESDTSGDNTELEAELQGFVKERLRSSRTPDHIVFRQELPYNETGKLLRRVLRDEYAHLGDA